MSTMDNEEFRQYLIYTLKNAKLYYLTSDKSIKRIYDKEQIDAQIKAKNETYNILMNVEAMNIIEYGAYHKEIPIDTMMFELLHEYGELLKKETIDIKTTDTIDEIADKLRDIGSDDTREDEITEDERAFDNTLLYKLRANKQLGIKAEHDFIKNNAK